MATIRKRGDLQWEAQVRRKGFPHVQRTFNSRDDAELWAKTTESEMGRGVFLDRSEAERTTIGDLIDSFCKEFAPVHYRVREDKKEAWRFQSAKLKGEIGKYSIAALDQKMVAKYRDDRQKDVSASTVRKELYLLSKILGFAETECGIALPRGNPVSKVRIPSEGDGRERRLKADELKKLEEECKASRNIYLWPAVELALETAMRQSEILGLQWKDVNLDRSTAFLVQTKNGEARAVPLSSRAVAIIKSLPRSISGGAVIPLQRMTLYHVFHAAVVRAKITDFTFHDLRHEAISRLAERGDFSVLELAAVSGHKTLQMLKKYTHFQAENLAKKMG